MLERDKVRGMAHQHLHDMERHAIVEQACSERRTEIVEPQFGATL